MRWWIGLVAATGSAALIGFSRLFDPTMHGQERTLLDVGVGAAFAGAGVTLLMTAWTRGRAVTVVAAALLLVAGAFAVMAAGDLRTDRGNKKALVALGIAAASGASVITAVGVRAGAHRDRSVPAPRS